MREDQVSRATATAPRLKVELPLLRPLSAEERARLKAHAQRVLANRERIGPIGIASDDLLHLARSHADADGR